MCCRLTPEKPQQRIALLGQSSQPLSPSAGVFPRNDPDVAGYSLAVAKPFRIAQENIGRQCRDRSSRDASSAVLLWLAPLPAPALARSVVRSPLEPHIHRLQLTATMRGVLCQR